MKFSENEKIRIRRASARDRNSDGLTFKQWLKTVGMSDDGEALPAGVSVGDLYDAWIKGARRR